MRKCDAEEDQHNRSLTCNAVKMEIQRSANHSSQEKKQDNPTPTAHCLRHSISYNSEIVHPVNSSSREICTKARQLKRPDHLIFNTQPTDSHYQGIPQGNRHPHPQPPIRKIDIRWKPTSTKSYTEHPLFHFQLPKTKQESEILTPRM